MDRTSHPGSDVDVAQSLMERVFAVGGTHHSMFSDSLASSEHILGATNAKHPSSPLRVRRDVPTTRKIHDNSFPWMAGIGSTYPVRNKHVKNLARTLCPVENKHQEFISDDAKRSYSM